jgi:glutathione S-transferase
VKVGGVALHVTRLSETESALAKLLNKCGAVLDMVDRAGSESAVVEALLEEAGTDYEVIAVERGTAGPEGFSRISPLGQVPALVLPDGTAMTESAAIAIYLADLYPKIRLAPPHGSPQRATYLRWMIYLAANIYMSNLRI